MSSIGSFGTFTTARLAIYVANKGLSVTGNNIANINTVGYTRQRLDQVSFKTGASDRYQNPYDARVGNGAIGKSVSQLRDPYLDVRYRAEHSSEGYYNGRLNGLDQLQSILDEIGDGDNDGDGLLYAQFSKFLSALQDVQVDAGHQVNDTLAYTSAKALCELFYSAASRLDQLHSNTEMKLRQEMDGINDLLLSIRKLNESIQEAEIYGDGALELRDQRNNYIDELSEKLKIEATYSMVKVGGKEVEKLTIRLANANPDPDVKSDSSILVDGNYCAQLTTPKANLDPDGNPVFNPAYEIFDKKSAAYEEAVKKLSKNPPEQVANPDAQNAFFTTKEDLDNYIRTFMEQSTNTMAVYRYVDENGQGTNDPREAAQVFDDNYNITVSDLRDKNNEAWEDGPQVRDVFVKEPLLGQLPTKAVLTGNFKITGGEWKDGDKIEITVGGTHYDIEVGKDVSASAANDDPKNISNAIRQALLKDPGLAKDYDITTRTTRTADGYNVDLTVKAKVPEEKANQPQITIETPAGGGNAQPAGSFTIGNPTLVADSKPPKYTATVTAGDKFNKGDKITFGTAPNDFTLEVGKDISVNAANDSERLAAKLAGVLGDANFKVSAKGDTLTFTAVDPANTTQPNITQPTFTPAIPASLGPLGNENWKEGKNNDGVDLTPPAVINDNGDNTEAKGVTRYYLDDEDRWHQVTKTTITSKTKVLDDNDLFGELQAVRELLTEEGEFSSQDDIDNVDESAAIKRGIPYYQQALDLLARHFAATMNEANNGYAVDEKGNYLDKNGEVLMSAGEPVNKNTGLTEAQKQAFIANNIVDADGQPDLKTWLETNGDKMGGNLFSNRGDTDDDSGITALNISVSQSWSNGDVHVVPTYIKLFGGEIGNTTQQDNALHMGHLMEEALVYNPQDLVGDALSTHLFEGSFQEFLVKMGTTLGEDKSNTRISLETHMGQALDIDTSRDAVSAVDLNDEAMDLMQYTHSLNAAYRLMTTLDEMLERLITGTGVTR